MDNVKFIILFIRKEITKSHENILIDFLKGLLGQNIKCEVNKSDIVVYYNCVDEVDFKEIVNVINNDIYIDLALFDGFVSNKMLVEYISFIKNRYYSLVGISDAYFDEKSLIRLSSKIDDENLRKNILKKYYNDYEMLNTIRVFIECNLNTSLAANKLYLHRNTLIGKIDRFIKVTGYDIKSFADAYIVYHILK